MIDPTYGQISYTNDLRIFSYLKRTSRKGLPAHYNQVYRTKNYEGPSKSMEVEAILQLTIEFWDEKNASIGTIAVDDDTTMKAHLRHNLDEKLK